MEYKFRVQTEEEQKGFHGGAHICAIYDFFKYAKEMGSKIPLAFGQLKARFGEPSYLTKNFENMYSYNLCAEAENGEKFYLYAYCGPTGPAIGGNSGDESTEKAARALADYIIEADPVDYEIEAYYLDGPCRLVQGVKDGVPYSTEEEIEFDDPALAELY